MTAALSSGSAGTQDKRLGAQSVRNVSSWQLSKATVEPYSKPLLIGDFDGIIFMILINTLVIVTQSSK